MSRFRTLPLLLAAACAPAATGAPPAGPPASAAPTAAAAPAPLPTAAERAMVGRLEALHERHRVAGLERRRFTHTEWWTAAAPLIEASPALQRERVGESVEGRALYLVRYGSGPVPVLLWSQMHGDESTASMALADLLAYFGTAADDPLARRIAERLTVWMIPMLNPDGAERFQRRNALGIDVNRDARTLATPEGRVLREAQRRLQPAFGFNLHDQNVRIPVAGTERIAALAFLAPPFDEARSDNEVRLRAARLAAVMRRAAEPMVGGHIARYDDTYNPRAFGDGMQRWGTSTVLVESGAWRDDPEKQYLRRVNFVILLAALDAIAGDEYAAADPADYRGLPFNGRPVDDLVVRGGSLVIPGTPPFRADLAVNFADPLNRTAGRITDVGDLGEASARDTLDVTGHFVHLAPEAVGGDAAGRAPLPLGAPASFVVRRSADPASPAVTTVHAGRTGRVGPSAPDDD